MGRLFKRGLVQTALLRKEWALGILYKRVDFIKSMSFLFWLLVLLTLLTKINVEIKSSAWFKVV